MRLASWMPFAQAARVLTDFTGVPVSEATVRRLTETAGAAVVAAQTAEVDRIEQELPAAPVAPARLVLSVDGAMVPLVGGVWAEVKTLALGEVRTHDTLDGPRVRTQALSYFSRLTDAAAFERLSLVETQRRGVEAAGQVAAVADGAEWIQSYIQTHAPGAVRILDFAHVVEHLNEVAGAVWGEGTPASQAWVRVQAEALKERGAAGVLAAVAELATTHPEQATISGALGYLEKRVTQMDYPGFVAAGWPVGSGMVESGNKLVVERRLKGPGMHWAREHVNPLLGLRNAVCNDRWGETWATITAGTRARATARRQARARGRATARAVKAVPAPPSLGGAAALEAAPAVNPAVVAQVEEVLRQPERARAGSCPRDGREPWRPAANHPWKRPFSAKARQAQRGDLAHAKP